MWTGVNTMLLASSPPFSTAVKMKKKKRKAEVTYSVINLFWHQSGCNYPSSQVLFNVISWYILLRWNISVTWGTKRNLEEPLSLQPSCSVQNLTDPQLPLLNFILFDYLRIKGQSGVPYPLRFCVEPYSQVIISQASKNHHFRKLNFPKIPL